MTEGSRGYAFDISEPLFFLTTECVRLHSNHTHRFQTLASIVNQRIGGMSEMAAHDVATLIDHLAVVPTKGDIRVYLSIPASTADALVAAKRQVSKLLERTLTVGDALSLLLFDYVVERKATGVLVGLGLATDEVPVVLAEEIPENGGNLDRLA